MSRLSMPTIAFLALALQIVLLRSADGTSSTDVDDHVKQRDTRIPDLWVSDLFYKALANFTLRRAADTECRRQTAVYERDLSNHTSWAVRSECIVFVLCYIIIYIYSTQTIKAFALSIFIVLCIPTLGIRDGVFTGTDNADKSAFEPHFYFHTCYYTIVQDKGVK